MSECSASPKVSIQEWKEIVAPFTQPSLARSLWQLLSTLALYALCFVLMVKSLSQPYWVTLLLSIPAGLMIVRVFIFFHDCGHGSFFRAKWANDLVGFITGMLTFTPYGHWRWQHSVHHATSGDLDRRGDGDIWTLTVREYLASSPKRRLFYRIMRNPIVLFVIAPLVLFLFYQRIPAPSAKGRDRRSVLAMNLALAAMVTGFSLLLGWREYLMIQLPITMVAGIAGIWMFYVQHQYEDVYWEHHDNWDYTTAALLGSSFYKLPRILQWCTGNIGFHHVHHLSSKIPNYNLERCHNSHPMFRNIKPLTFWESLKCMKLSLWDEDNRRLISFSELKSLGQTQAVAS
jgi:omega-6 fatty acid desaturase (delta-12 desaturase)